MKLGFIGAGNMGGALLKGCVESGKYESRDIMVCDKDPERRRNWEDLLLVKTTENVEDLVAQNDLILLAIKPDGYEEVLPVMKANWSARKVLVSMAAGISLEYMERILPLSAKIIRIMPNTPAMVGEGMMAVSPNRNVSTQDLEEAMEIFRSVGQAEVVSEDLMDCVIGVSGSSPAYTYLYIESLIEGAVNNGMEKELATRFAAQSVLGAAKMVLETGLSPKQLCLNVCSPGGTTIEAVNTIFENGFKENVKEAFQAAVEKSKIMNRT
jgi:pyrroline-5-carboxylate reductase